MSSTLATLPAETEFTATLQQTFGASNYDQLLSDTRADCEALNVHTRQAAMHALRVGTRLVCISLAGKRGALTAFVKLCKGLPGMSERNLYSWKELAEGFLKKHGYLKGDALTDAAPVHQIANEQLELWTPERGDSIGQAVAWINGRGIAEMLREIAEESDGPKGRTLITGKQSPGADHSAEAVREREIAAAAEMANQIQQWLGTDAAAVPCAERGRRLTLEEIEAEKRPVTVGLLTTEHLEAMKVAGSQLAETAAHYLDLRQGVTPVAKRRATLRTQTLEAPEV